MTQHDLIIRYLKQHKVITPMDAFNDLGITKLSTRIGELKKRGYTFSDFWVESVNRFGEKVRYKMYKLIRSHDWSEEDLLELSKEQFTAHFEVSDEEYEMLHKEMQEM